MTATGIRNMTAVALADLTRHQQQGTELAVGDLCGGLAYGAANIRRNPNSVRWLPVTAVTADGGAVVITAGGRTFQITPAGCYTPLVVKAVTECAPRT
jgi:hypothetical protein